MRVCAQSCLFVTPPTVARQTPLSMGFSRQEYWNGLPFPPPGDLPHLGIKPKSLVSSVLVGRFFITEPPGKPIQGIKLPNLCYLDNYTHTHKLQLFIL